MDWQMDEWPDEPAKGPSNTGDRDNVPEGRWRFEIVRASEEGPKLKLALSKLEGDGHDKRYGWVWCNLPRDKDWGARVVTGLAGSLGMDRPTWNASPIDALVGRQVEAEIYHKQVDTKLFVNVAEFHRPEPVAAAKPARRPAAAKAIETDDIPF